MYTTNVHKTDYRLNLEYYPHMKFLAKISLPKQKKTTYVQ